MSKRERLDGPDMFNVSDVTWDIPPSKRRDQVTIVLKTESSFNLMKTYLTLKMICEKIETQLGIMEEAGREQ